MTQIFFLQAAVPLTKTFRALADGSIQKEAYPLVTNVTTHEVLVNDIQDFYKAVQAHAALNHCLLKGIPSRPLVNESRRGTTNTDALTEWVCLDFDRHVCPNIDDELTRMGLGDVSYVIQYSASHGLPGTEGSISAHVFMLLDGALPAPDIKAWLMDLNFRHLADGIRLSRSKNVLSWPLDITTCQNDKILYIAPPVFTHPLKDHLHKRIEIISKKFKKLPVARVGGGHINALKTQERKILNELRKAEGLSARTAKTSWVGSVEVQNKPDTCTVTGIKESGDFVRLNLNGGDSWAYSHPKDNFELIYDFKSDTWYKAKELVPGYYATLIAERQALTATPTEDGDLILAFRDLKTAEYYNGLWNPTLKRLEMYRAKNETQLDHWMRSHGRVLGEFIPVWDIQYNPREDWIVDEENHLINTFRPSHYMYLEPLANNDFPHISGIIYHMLGCVKGRDEDDALVAHFLNWFACIMQRVHKPLTAWVTHGIEGTGKGYFINKIAMPVLGHGNVMSVIVDNVEDSFNGWIEGKLLVFTDEVDVDDFKDKGRVTAKLRNYITEPTITLRRMRQQAISAPNYASFIFSSNKKQPVFIPETDRRYNVGNFQRAKLMRPNDKAVERELEAFAKYLLAHKVDIEQANSVMHTEARDRIAKLSVTSLTETCNAVLNGDLDTLWMAMPDEALMMESGFKNRHSENALAYCLLMRRIAAQVLDNPLRPLSRDELLIILQYNVGNMPETPNKFTSLLRHNGIETTRVRRGETRFYGIDITWKVTDELRAEILQTLKPSKIRKIK